MKTPLLQVVHKLLEDLDTPISLKVNTLIKNGEWDQIANLGINPTHYIDSPFGAERFKRDSQAVNLLRKAVFLPIKVDREQAAHDTFWAAEKQCKQTNDRFDPRFIRDELHELDPRMAAYFGRVRKMIKTILGPIPQNIELSFGPGATFEMEGVRLQWPRTRSVQRALNGLPRKFTLSDKLKRTPAVTADARSIFEHYFWPSTWGRHHLSQVRQTISETRGNRFTTVDKTAVTDRGICIEPGGNVCLQLPIGAHIRRRLQRYNLLLPRSKEIHMQLACVGSLHGGLCTVDLSAASDTVAKHLVKYLLPDEWYCLLDSLRSHYTRIKKPGSKKETWVLLEKFSSMGNGFTFELETLIFACLAASLQDEGVLSLGSTVNVFGDDIIVPKDSAHDLISVLRFTGFTPNSKKTFVDGPFRESCGGDFFCGIDVRSHFIKGEPIEPTDWIGLANGLYRRLCNMHLRNAPGYRARLRALDQLPNDIRSFRGPYELGDIVIHDVTSRWRPIIKDSIRWFHCLVPFFPKVPLWVNGGHLHMAAALWGRSSTGEVPRRCEPLGYKKELVPFS